MFGFILHLIKIMPISDGMYYAEPLSALAIGGIIGGAKALSGIGQMLFSGRRKAEPKYEIPQEVFDVTKEAQQLKFQGLPSITEQKFKQEAEKSAVFALRGAQDRRGGLANIGGIQFNLDRANLALAAQDAAMRQQNIIRAQQALMVQAQFRDKAFANQWQSWMNREQQRRALVGAGLQNIMGGLDTAASIYASSLENNTGASNIPKKEKTA